MTEELKPGLPVAGYHSQSDVAIALVNEFKQDEERLLRKLDAMRRPSQAFRAGEGTPLADDINRYDQRWLSVARTKFEEAYMALNRAVFQPGRVKLPEDEA